MNEVVAAKVGQAIDLMREFDLPLWIVQFARESYDNPAPVQELAVGTTVTWPAAFILTDRGDRIAIVGTGDVDQVKMVGVYDRVVGYVKDVGPDLRRILQEFDPAHIGVSYSLDDDHADSITHGMYLLLQQILANSPYSERLVSADRVLAALRARKLPVETERIRSAIRTTLDIFDAAERCLKPGVTELDIWQVFHNELNRRGVEPAWDGRYNPVVNFGAESTFGHAGPGNRALEPGMLVHVDFGVKQQGYCSDLQRTWYLPEEGESGAPEDIAEAFTTLVASMEAGFRALRPGVPGWQVDAAARQVLVDAGYEEPEFAFGHQMGQTTHDGGGLLGPRWPRYGNRPAVPIEAGNVFTLEFALRTRAGVIGLEEDVAVTETGAEYLSPPQTELKIVRP